ncbi:hypothetical protein BH09MYX1_BH09MYX1_47740 [soil metagenome]
MEGFMPPLRFGSVHASALSVDHRLLASIVLSALFVPTLALWFELAVGS